MLLIEADAPIRETIAVRLRRAGFRVRSVRDGGAAADALARTRFDVTVGDGSVQQALQRRLTGAFAVITRPLDFEELVRAVGRGVAGTPEGIDFHALQRFVGSVPELRDALAAPMPSTDELMLRTEIRRTILELCGALEAAAEGEPDRVRAAVLLAAAAVAADLASARGSAFVVH